MENGGVLDMHMTSNFSLMPDDESTHAIVVMRTTLERALSAAEEYMATFEPFQ